MVVDYTLRIAPSPADTAASPASPVRVGQVTGTGPPYRQYRIPRLPI